MNNQALKQQDTVQGHKPCEVYRKCGGCQLQNMDYPRQLQWKQSRCVKLLKDCGRVLPIIPMANPYNYRNKVQAAFQMNRGGRIVSGIYQSSTGHIVTPKRCQTEDRQAQKIVKSIEKLVQSFKLKVYDPISKRGFIRHVLVRRGFATGEIMVVLVAGTPVFTAKKNFVNALLKLHPEITTVVHNVYTGGIPMILGNSEKVLYGPGFIKDILCGCKFRISSRSFYQINPVQTEVLYNTAIEFAQLTEKDKVLDAYCGIGTISLAAAKYAGHVTGVEIVGDAIRDAVANARENKIKNTWFQTGDAGEFMTELADAGEKIDVLFMDPPRTGADSAFLSAVLKLSPGRVVYISCNPETLARDLRRLIGGGYKVTQIQPVDMFPHTNHVETVVLMSRKGG